MKKIEPTLFDPLAPDVLKDPFDAYGKAREQSPVMKVSGRFEQDFYIVTRYDDVKNVMSDHTHWTKREGALLRSTERDIAMSQDPPEFNLFRSIYAAYMGPKGVSRWADAMHRYVDEYLDTLEPQGQGNLHDDFARPLPVKVMATVVGLPFEGLDEYQRLTDFFLTSQFNEVDPQIGQRLIAELYDLFDQQFAIREKLLRDAGITEPTTDLLGDVLSDDLLSLLTVSRYKGRPLNVDERRRTARGFFVGNDTFTSLFLNLLYRLLEDRSRWEAVSANRNLIDVAIEESLRFDPPNIGMFRLSACPVNLHGVDIPDHARVLFAIPAANRDPNVFEKPDEFRLDRKPLELRQHLGFGNGPHYCPGAFIARLEAKIALNGILDRMPNLTLTEAPVRIDPFNFWGYKTFQAQW
jgi:cytochrome P450